MKRRLPMLRGKGNQDVSPHTVLLHPERLAKIRTWRKPRVVLTPMLGDYFHEQVPREFLIEVFYSMLSIPGNRHQWVVLTKRPQRAVEFFDSLDEFSHAGGPLDVSAHTLSVAWQRKDPVLGKLLLMASVWDQPSADAACSALSQLRGIRWGLHAEPLLGPIKLEVPYGPLDAIKAEGSRCGHHGNLLHGKPCPICFPRIPAWVVAGGENGPGARPMETGWVRSLRDQCQNASVPFWYKGPGTRGLSLQGDGGISNNGRDTIDDIEHNETPWSKAGTDR